MRTSRESPFGRRRAAKAEAINCPRRVVLRLSRSGPYSFHSIALPGPPRIRHPPALVAQTAVRVRCTKRWKTVREVTPSAVSALLLLAVDRALGAIHVHRGSRA